MGCKETRTNFMNHMWSLYKDAVMSDALSFYMVNLTKNTIEEDMTQNQINSSETSIDIDLPCKYSEFMEKWMIKKVTGDKKEFMQKTGREEIISRYENGEKEVQTEYFITDDDGQLRRIRNVYVFTKDDKTQDICAILIIKDRTKRWKRKRKEQQKEEIIKALSEDYETVFYIDTKRDYVETYRMSDSFKKEFGESFSNASYNETMTSYMENCVYKEDAQKFAELTDINNMVSRLENDKYYDFIYRRHYDGKIEYLKMKMVSAAVNEEESTVVIGVKSVDEEIRKEIDIKEKLKNALAVAEYANKEKELFLSNMTRDIRVPVNDVMRLTSMVLTQTEDKNAKDYLKRILASGNKLLSLINDVLDMSRMESGNVVIEESENNLREIVAEIENVYQPQMEEKMIEFSVDISGIKNADIYCDRLRFSQVINNILDNSMKFTQAGGKVQFLIEQREEEAMGIANYHISIKDNGVGIKPDFVGKIFDPFEREENEIKNNGSGLGMAITKNIVNMLGGNIGVNTKYGRGTEFYVDIPLKIQDTCLLKTRARNQNDMEQDEFIEQHEKIMKNSKRILLIENDEIEAEIAKKVLLETGFIVEHVTECVSAVELLKEREPSYYKMILVDASVHNTDGYEAARQIRNLPDYEKAHIPIIAMTDGMMEWEYEEEIDCEINAHMIKPINVTKLLETLDSMLREDL